MTISKLILLFNKNDFVLTSNFRSNQTLTESKLASCKLSIKDSLTRRLREEKQVFVSTVL